MLQSRPVGTLAWLRFAVTVVDAQDSLEFTPGLPKVLREPDALAGLRVRRAEPRQDFTERQAERSGGC